MTVEVRARANDPTPRLITRAVHRNRGWQWVRYRGARYQVFGGVRGAYFIDLQNPLRARVAP